MEGTANFPYQILLHSKFSLAIQECGLQTNFRNETYSIYPDQVYPFHIGYHCHKGHRKIPRQFDQQVLLQPLVCSLGQNHNPLHFHGIHNCHSFAEVNRKRQLRGGYCGHFLGFKEYYMVEQQQSLEKCPRKLIYR